MATQDDVRRISMSLPEVTEAVESFAFGVARNSFAWIYPERIHPRKARVPNPDVVVVRISGEEEKQTLISAEPTTFFTTDHYNGYPAVLVRLPQIDILALEDLLTDAWYLRAPKSLQAAFDRDRSSPTTGDQP